VSGALSAAPVSAGEPSAHPWAGRVPGLSGQAPGMGTATEAICDAVWTGTRISKVS
jgi:hypothetical protein